MNFIFEVAEPDRAGPLDFAVVTGQTKVVLARSLQNLHITDCFTLKKLPMQNLLKLHLLVHLNLSRLFAVDELPDMEQMLELKHLVLINMPMIQGLCERAVRAPQLNTLTVSELSQTATVDDSFYEALSAKPKFRLLSMQSVPAPLPPQMSRLRNLETLHIHAPSPRTTQLPDLSQMAAMRDLRLSTMPALQELPPSLWTLATLEILVLSDLPIAEIGTGIGNLRKLKEMRLVKLRQVHKLPDSLWTVTTLETLALFDLPLKELPACIGKLVNLKDINLEDLLIDSVPVEAATLHSLVFFRMVRCNQCMSLPTEVLVSFSELWRLIVRFSPAEADAQGEQTAVFRQVARALPQLRRVEWLTLLGLQSANDASALGRALASPTAGVSVLRLDDAVMAYWRMHMLAVEGMQEPEFLCFWRGRQDKVLSFVQALHPRLGEASGVSVLNELMYMVVCEVFTWEW